MDEVAERTARLDEINYLQVVHILKEAPASVEDHRPIALLDNTFKIVDYWCRGMWRLALRRCSHWPRESRSII